MRENAFSAIFDAAAIVEAIPEQTAVILDLTLPGPQLDARELVGHLYRRFQGRSRLFLIGSTSKSHNTAEYRIGWAICARSEDAALLRKENRNVVSSIAVEEAVRRLRQPSPVNVLIEGSFCLLRGPQGRHSSLFSPPGKQSPVMCSFAFVMIPPCCAG